MGQLKLEELNSILTLGQNPLFQVILVIQQKHCQNNNSTISFDLHLNILWLEETDNKKEGGGVKGKEEDGRDGRDNNLVVQRVFEDKVIQVNHKYYKQERKFLYIYQSILLQVIIIMKFMISLT